MRGIFTAGVGERAGFAALYLCVAAAGRVIVVDRDPVVLIWPGAGLAVVWLITRRSSREWVIDLPLIVLVGVAASLLTGLGPGATAVLTTSNLVAVVVVVVAMRRWSPTTARDGVPPSETPQAMLGFLAAAGIGSLVGVVVGAIGLWATGHDFSSGGLLTWWGRNVCGIVAIGAIALLMMDRLRRVRRSIAPSGGGLELAALFALTGGLMVVDYVSPLPISFLLPALSVWAGSRFTPIGVSAHALLAGAGLLFLTYLGHGPFVGMGEERASIALAQLFVAMTLVIGLLLAAAREARSSLQADLLAKERAQSEELLTFARRVAHDVRNPLAVIESWTAELASTLAASPAGPPPGTATMIGGIERATTRMGSLVDHLLADASARGRTPEHAVVDLATLVADVATEYDAAELVQASGARLVAGDPVLLRQLVDNLVANAVKYVRPGESPDITVTTEVRGDRVVVRVADRGVGIPNGANDWIFEPFKRAHDDAYPGTGLGLSMCRRIVERHGGSIRASCRDDGPGAVFELDLPHPKAARSQSALVDTCA